MSTMNAHIVDQPGSDTQHTVDLHIDNPDAIGGGGASSIDDGSITGVKLANKTVTKDKIADGVIPDAPVAATDKKAGLVKKAAAVAAVAAADSAAAAADTVTKAEFDKLVTEANETKRQLNALIAAGKAAGWLA